MAQDHDRRRDDLAAYALGALTPIESASVEEHVRACEDCRAELERLKAGVAVLGRSVDSVEPPPSLKKKLMSEVEADLRRDTTEAPQARRRENRSRRWRDWLFPSLGLRPAGAAAAATVLLALGGLGGWILSREDAPRERSIAAVVDRERLPEAVGKLELAAGDQASLELAGLPDLGKRSTYEVWVQRGGEVTAGPLFGPTSSGKAIVGIPGELKGVEAVMVTREPAGGSRSPTEKPVVQVPVSS